jgi:hypothetical protein
VTHRRIARLCLGLVLWLGGCAAGGAAFQPVDRIPTEKALVYIYRPNSIVGGAIRYHVADGEIPVVYLIRGGYFPYFAEPGEHTFWARTESRSEVTTDLHPGETYYLRGRIGAGIAVGRPSLEFVEPSIGAKEVRKLKLLPPAER